MKHYCLCCIQLPIKWLYISVLDYPQYNGNTSFDLLSSQGLNLIFNRLNIVFSIFMISTYEQFWLRSQFYFLYVLKHKRYYEILKIFTILILMFSHFELTSILFLFWTILTIRQFNFLYVLNLNDITIPASQH